jgi:hypothetical protein
VSGDITGHAAPVGSLNGAAPAGPLGRHVTLTPASQTIIRPVRWTWTDRIPAGAITLIPGREGIGKSLLLAWLTAQITRGTLPGDCCGQARPVIYAATEDSWSQTIAPRLLAAGADLDLVYRVEVDFDGAHDTLTFPRDCDAIAAEILRLGVAMLAADPLLSLISAAINTHQDRDLRNALEPLARLADTTACAVVGLAHFNKSAGDDAANLITGSRAFSAVARAVIAVARDNDATDGSCVASQIKNNLGRLNLPSLRYVVESVELPTDEGPAFVGRLNMLGETDRSVTDILGDTGTDAPSRSERDHVAIWLTDYLTAHGREASWADIRAAARDEGVAERTLQRVRERLGIVSERSGVPPRSIWRLAADDSRSPSAPTAPQSRHPRQGSEPGADGAIEPTDKITSYGPSRPRLVDVSRSSSREPAA